jgi:hypothetical protein
MACSAVRTDARHTPGAADDKRRAPHDRLHRERASMGEDPCSGLDGRDPGSQEGAEPIPSHDRAQQIFQSFLLRAARAAKADTGLVASQSRKSPVLSSCGFSDRENDGSAAAFSMISSKP